MSNDRPSALVTGASSGLGAALAKGLARDGYEVWAAARRLELLEAVVQEIEASGGKAHPLQLDVSDPDATARAVEALDDKCNGLDLVVANAGVSGLSRAHRISWPVAQNTLMTNLVGTAATILPLVPRMMVRRRGHLVGISSLLAELPVPLAATYGATKAGISYLFLALGPALRKKGVATTLVHPGFINTPMVQGASFSMPLLVEPDQAAAIIRRAIRRKKALVRFPFVLGVALRMLQVLPRRVREWLILRAGM